MRGLSGEDDSWPIRGQGDWTLDSLGRKVTARSHHWPLSANKRAGMMTLDQSEARLTPSSSGGKVTVGPEKELREVIRNPVCNLQQHLQTRGRQDQVMWKSWVNTLLWVFVQIYKLWICFISWIFMNFPYNVFPTSFYFFIFTPPSRQESLIWIDWN